MGTGLIRSQNRGWGARRREEMVPSCVCSACVRAGERRARAHARPHKRAAHVSRVFLGAVAHLRLGLCGTLLGSFVECEVRGVTTGRWDGGSGPTREGC